MKLFDGIPVYGDLQPEALDQMKRCAEHDDVVGCALMADHHLGYAVPVGGVIAYGEHVSPSGVGYDIACGNKAVRLDMPAVEVRESIGAIMDAVWSALSFGVGRKNADAPDDPLFEDDAWRLDSAAPLLETARAQLGTIGSGNHYVDLFADEQDRTWVGVHFGSRGLGHKLATHYIKAGGGRDGIHVDPVLLHQDSDLGREYIAAMTLAGAYAYAGRDWVCQRVADLLGAPILDEVHNHHNFAWRESHGGRDVWVVRKGATPAFPGQRGFVGGSMGDISVILEGVDSADAAPTFASTVHGAGRVMSRTAAAGKYKGWGEKRHQVSRGAVSEGMMAEWLFREGVTLRGAGLDESPHCYRRLPDVLAAHADSVRILHTLTPIGVAMAGAGEFDPYKD
ncbi:MAG: RtcB family protein [Ardenticatenales bacterium]